jgi:hypothetical protein
MNDEKRFRVRTIAAMLAAAFPIAGMAAPAAQVDFAIGNVTAVRSNGQSRAIAKGAQIEQGETVATNNGRAQLRFTDGAYVSLQPESEFRIDQYRFDGKQDGNEKGFFSLIKGGLRTITGLVGRTNKNNYQVSTSVATIGIRGTEYTIQYGQSVVGTVGEGEINVCNGAGCLSVTNGESYYVQNDGVKPVLTNKRTDLPPPSPQNPPSTFAEGENVNENGESCTLDPVSCEPPAPTGLLTGTLSPGNVAYAMQFGSRSAQTTPATLDADGLLVSFDRFGSAFSLSNHVPKVGTEAGNDGIIAWGYALDSSGAEAIHYAVGIVPTISDLNTAFSQMTGTYELIGATKLTGSNGSSGTLINASLSVDFGQVSNNVFVGMNLSLAGSTVNASATGSFSGSSVFFASGGLQGSGTYLDVAGFFAGANAERAGMSYLVADPSVNNNESFVGAAALKQSSLTPNGQF